MKQECECLAAERCVQGHALSGNGKQCCMGGAGRREAGGAQGGHGLG